MRTKFLVLTFATLLGGTALVGPAAVSPASAEDVIVEHYDEDTGVMVTTPDGPAVIEDDEDGPVIIEQYPPPPATRYEPPVYGWISVAPVNCGTFKYWNGERCADARYDPEE